MTKPFGIFLLIYGLCSTWALASNRASGAPAPSLEPISSAEMGDAGPFDPVTVGQGIHFQSPDGTFSSTLRFRIQNRADFTFLEEEGDEGTRYLQDWQVRRARLRFQGHVVDPKLRYLIQLSFSRADQDWDNSGVPNVLRDAMILYDVTDDWQVAFGQGKLPGNRQRVVSSGDLQFVDRSLLNARFNVDRDFGFQTQYKWMSGSSLMRLKGSITSGEGRNRNVPNRQRSFYVGRWEWLPFGEFQRNGDYFEGDLVFEETPKLSLAYSYASMPGAARAGGTIGNVLSTVDGDGNTIYLRRSQHVQFVDGVLKWKGYAASFEYATRQADDPVIDVADELGVLTGQGFNFQLSKMISEKVEVGARYTQIDPTPEVRVLFDREAEKTLVLSRYFNGHRTKLQGEVSHLEGEQTVVRLQLELGI